MNGPSKVLLSLEAARGIYEYCLGLLLNAPLKLISPKGDGHPVMVLPGLGGSDGSTLYIRTYLQSIGYNCQSWGLGRNLGPRHGIEKLMADLGRQVRDLSDSANGDKVTLIGWSLGGIYSREIAKECPDIVRQVITLGSPFKCVDTGTNAGAVYEMLSRDLEYKKPEVVRKISQRPPVPFTSIYSKTDGVVNWRCSIEEESADSQNIEVPMASHMGLGFNPIAMYLVAERLAQTKETWKPYKFG